jgi:mitogen-activated protein kinase kinase kinase
MEMDQTHLKDMGIKKVGDRVRIGSQAKQLRNKEYKKASRRTSNRVRHPSSFSNPQLTSL